MSTQEFKHCSDQVFKISKVSEKLKLKFINPTLNLPYIDFDFCLIKVILLFLF